MSSIHAQSFSERTSVIQVGVGLARSFGTPIGFVYEYGFTDKLVLVPMLVMLVNRIMCHFLETTLLPIFLVLLKTSLSNFETQFGQ